MASTTTSTYVTGVHDIAALTQARSDYRNVVATGPHSQLVTMCIEPGDSIGMEVHEDADQVLVVVDGVALAVLDGIEHVARVGQLIYVPAGVEHDIVNAASVPLRLYTMYTPAEHPDGLVQPTKASAAEYEASHH